MSIGGDCFRPCKEAAVESVGQDGGEFQVGRSTFFIAESSGNGILGFNDPFALLRGNAWEEA
jgi:hypothetical protein